MTNTPTKGIVYLVWGGEEHRKQLEQSVNSVKKIHPEIPIHICDLDKMYPDSPKGLGVKSFMDRLSPFDLTLFLDTDTQVIGDISYGFEKAKEHGMAITIDHACYVRRWPETHKLLNTHINKDTIEYNTGVIFFNKHMECVQKVFEQWKAWSGLSWNDQPSFAVAVEQCSFAPFVLPDHIWNYRVYNADRLFGPIKIWHTESPMVLTNRIQNAITQEHNWRMYQVQELLEQDPADREGILQL